MNVNREWTPSVFLNFSSLNSDEGWKLSLNIQNSLLTASVRQIFKLICAHANKQGTEDPTVLKCHRVQTPRYILHY